KEAAKSQWDNLKHSSGVSLTGRLPNEKEALDPKDDLLMGFFTIYRPKPDEKTFWSAPFKNAAQFVPRYIFTPVLKNLIRHRHAPEARYDMPALNGVYRTLTRLLFDTKIFKDSKFYQKEFVPNWVTGIGLTFVTPVGLYFALFDPFRWFLAADQSMQEYSEEERYSKIIQWDPRFADLKDIKNSKDRLKQAKARYAEIEYFKRKLLMLSSREGFFSDPSQEFYENVLSEMKHESPATSENSRLAMPVQKRNILDRFELAGLNEFKFVQKLTSDLASKVLDKEDVLFGTNRKIVVRLKSDDALCVVSCEDVEGMKIVDKTIRSHVEGFLRMSAIDALLFPKNSEMKNELKDSPALARALKSLEADSNVKRVLKLNTNVFAKRALLVQFEEYRARKNSLKSMGMEYHYINSKGVEMNINEDLAMAFVLANFQDSQK
nr:hypothetical protein [Pseudomonadota bacterium]